MKNNLNLPARLRAIDSDLQLEIYRFKGQLFGENKFLTYDKVQEEIYLHFCVDLGFPYNEVFEALKMSNAIQKRRVRLLDRMNEIVFNNKTVYFGTLTFTDDVLQKTSEETRRRYVARYLKSFSSSYVANVDYGDKHKNANSKQREHYHCVVGADHVPTSWLYGFSKFEIVRKQDSDAKRLRSYIDKLTNHAMKVEKTGRAKRLIYSRGHVAPHWLLDED